MTNQEAFNQGARCGHIEGKGRAGQYVIDEEFPLATEAAANQNLSLVLTFNWEHGYRLGYRLAASGEELPSRYAQ